MLTLGIETSGRSGTAALCRREEIIAERNLFDAGRRHAQSLVVEIDALFRSAGRALCDCQLVAVSIGPGSFTGLRVGVVCAKTLAYAIGCPLVAVDTFECIAGNSPDNIAEVLVLDDAQRGGIYAGRYRRESTHLWRQADPITVVAQDLQETLPIANVPLSGWGVEKLAPELVERSQVLDRVCWTPAASTVARIGARLAAEGRISDAFALEPFYLRQSAAEEKAAAASLRAT